MGSIQSGKSAPATSAAVPSTATIVACPSAYSVARNSRLRCSIEKSATCAGRPVASPPASTVYRTLELLEREGLVTHTHFDDGVTRWHLASEQRHQHLVCRSCGDELELEVALLEPAARKIRERFGFEPDMAHFAIAGTCA